MLDAAGRVEVSAGKIAFGESVAAVFDGKHDYAKQVASRQSQSYPLKVLRAYTRALQALEELSAIMPETLCEGPLRDGDEAGGPTDALVVAVPKHPAKTVSTGKDEHPARYGLVLSWWASAGSWWALLRLLWLDDFVQSIFDGRYFKFLTWPLLCGFAIVLVYRPDWIVDCLASIFFGALEHAADRSVASVYRLGRRGAEAVTSVATRTQDVAEAVATVIENASLAWENLSDQMEQVAEVVGPAVTSAVEASVELVDFVIDKTATAAADKTAELLDNLPEQLQAGAVDMATTMATAIVEVPPPPTLDTQAPPVTLQTKKGGWVKYGVTLVIGAYLQRRFRG